MFVILRNQFLGLEPKTKMLMIIEMLIKHHIVLRIKQAAAKASLNQLSCDGVINKLRHAK